MAEKGKRGCKIDMRPGNCYANEQRNYLAAMSRKRE